jgi:hypothetical protein
MAVYASVTGRVTPGKLNEAAAYLARYAEGIKKISGHDVQILGQVGEIDSVMTVTTYEDLADMEKTIRDVWPSQEYRQLMDSAKGLFSAAETHVFLDT